MSFSALFVRRPVATTLLSAAVAVAGLIALRVLPVASLPQVDFPTLRVSASISGADPETMASSVATPLENAFGRIAGITEMTSQSGEGSTEITLQFELSRDINGAAREVQAAINAATPSLPTGLTGNPTYKKTNPTESPIVMMSLTSGLHSRAKMYDIATSMLAQKISALEGVGEVSLFGGSLPAIRVNLDPDKLRSYGIASSAVAAAIKSANANMPKGFLENDSRRLPVVANDIAETPADYRGIVVAMRAGAPVLLGDIAEIGESSQDRYNDGRVNGVPAILFGVTRQPGANVIGTIERIREALPALRALLPEGMTLDLTLDRSRTIRASLKDVSITLGAAVLLVTGVVWLFLRDIRATLIPALAVPLSIIGTLPVMWLAGFSLNILSLMALTVATGFVVDDAIVVLENISRHLSNGVPRVRAAILGAREVAFTVVSISLSLVAVFIPILLMEGLLGRLFREFAVTLSAAILVSLLVSLTTTPALCAVLLRRESATKAAKKSFGERALAAVIALYARSLAVVLRRPAATIFTLLLAVATNAFLVAKIPKGLLPQQDTGFLMGGMRADRSASYEFSRERSERLARIVGKDPAVESVSTGVNSGDGRFFVSLKPLEERDGTLDEILARIRKKTAEVPGVQLFLNPRQDVRAGGRQADASYQYTLMADDIALLNAWSPKVSAAFRELPDILTDVSSDNRPGGLRTVIDYDRQKLAAFGLSVTAANGALYDAFGQELVSTIYKPLNQYRVVLESSREYVGDPGSLDRITLVGGGGAAVPFGAFSTRDFGSAPHSVNHQGGFAASTVSFNLAPRASLSDAEEAIRMKMREIGLPPAVQGSFQGTAKLFGDSLSGMALLVVAAVVAMYIVLGVLYESWIHPLTILSTIPSAGVGALLALMMFGYRFDTIALIGVLLLIGIVKKNAILMIDFAIRAEREDGLSPRDAILEACRLRFRPILMTTLAAIFGALPLAVGFGEGSEMRRPLGVAIIGGLVFSQMLTLYTTPVVYLLFDRLALRFKKHRAAPVPPEESPAVAGAHA